jgi:glycosyltransferase involved in cell wall biosynthesis
VVHFGAGEIYRPATWQEKDAVKETYSEGLEYFLYSGPIDPKQNLINLLKAFSFFKKRQKSNMQLIIASGTAATDKAFIKSLGSFKYRNEVKVLDKLPGSTLAKITGSAYALVYPSVYENFAAAIPAAMQSGVPVVTGNGHAMKEIFGDAVLYSNTADINDIADKMMLLFKDENKRNELIAKGRQQAILYDRVETMATIWKAILKSTGASF